MRSLAKKLNITTSEEKKEEKTNKSTSCEIKRSDGLDKPSQEHPHRPSKRALTGDEVKHHQLRRKKR